MRYCERAGLLKQTGWQFQPKVERLRYRASQLSAERDIAGPDERQGAAMQGTQDAGTDTGAQYHSLRIHALMCVVKTSTHLRMRCSHLGKPGVVRFQYCHKVLPRSRRDLHETDG